VRPYTTAGGKTLHVRVESAKQPSVTELRSWAAHEKVSVRCRAVNPQRSVGFDAEHPFPVGESSTQFIDRLRTFLLTPVKQTGAFIGAHSALIPWPAARPRFASKRVGHTLEERR